jgi:hypothetical protein
VSSGAYSAAHTGRPEPEPAGRASAGRLRRHPRPDRMSSALPLGRCDALSCRFASNHAFQALSSPTPQPTHGGEGKPRPASGGYSPTLTTCRTFRMET